MIRKTKPQTLFLSSLDGQHGIGNCATQGTHCRCLPPEKAATTDAGKDFLRCRRIDAVLLEVPCAHDGKGKQDEVDSLYDRGQNAHRRDDCNGLWDNRQAANKTKDPKTPNHLLECLNRLWHEKLKRPGFLRRMGSSTRLSSFSGSTLRSSET